MSQFILLNGHFVKAINAIIALSLQKSKSKITSGRWPSKDRLLKWKP